MARPKKKREIVHLTCSETGERNYTIKKKPGSPKLQLMKYCPRLRKHTMHTEKKK
ncbi:MAG: 50S ribosomal protein L33 [Planctomycetes bacterium]|nr:50S ribosomal protein L33 [Planctomycetota bacterium]MCB9919269.1 50S ribosomal protein L33 [Planctomycetota bacterium]